MAWLEKRKSGLLEEGPTYIAGSLVTDKSATARDCVIGKE